MSIAALAWVFKQDIRPSTLKFVFVALADCANEKDEMKCWPSVKHICDITSQDRKTVLSSIAQLVKDQWLVDTGERKGRTKQVKVYRLNLERENGAKIGTIRSNKSSPKTVLLKSPVFPNKESQKRDTEPLLIPYQIPPLSP